MSDLEYYRKRPVLVRSRRWDGTAQSAAVITDWVEENGGRAEWVPSIAQANGLLLVWGGGSAATGDFVTFEEDGSFHARRPDPFLAEHERVAGE